MYAHTHRHTETYLIWFWCLCTYDIAFHLLIIRHSHSITCLCVSSLLMFPRGFFIYSTLNYNNSEFLSFQFMFLLYPNFLLKLIYLYMWFTFCSKCVKVSYSTYFIFWNTISWWGSCDLYVKILTMEEIFLTIFIYCCYFPEIVCFNCI